jgi:light-regulated signal transduction histidine kinase (bacteriophytochrome)
MSEDTLNLDQLVKQNERLKQLIKSNRKLTSSFISIVSHDIGNALFSISAFSTELSRHCQKLLETIDQMPHSPDCETVKKFINDYLLTDINFISQSSDHILNTLKGIKKVSKVSHLTSNINKQDTKAIVQQVLDSTAVQIRKSGAQVQLDDIPDCLADKYQLEMIFSILLDNAFKYLDPNRKGLIHIWSQNDGQHVIYCVEDNGKGIPTDYQDRVFEIFQRVHKDDSIQGEGLGLTIMQRLLDLNHGNAWIESEPGNFTRAFISLPAET